MRSRVATVAIAVVAQISLSRPLQAQRLPTTAVPTHYDLSFVVDLDHARFDGEETIRINVTEPTHTIVVHAIDLTIQEARISVGQTSQKATVSLAPSDQTAALTVSQTVPAGAAELHLRFAGVLNDKLRGFYLSTEKGRRYAVTQFESTDARRAFPCFDEPALKATFDLTLTLARDDAAVSNGRVISDTPARDRQHHIVKFSTTPKMSTYLLAMAVGNFECLEGGVDKTPIRVCTTGGKKQLGRIALDSAQQILEFYNHYFVIPYPFGKLDMVAIPDFAAGAMENTAAIFYRESDLLTETSHASVSVRKNIASIIAHETAHQWFGDLVTMKWWDDLWLNEGFATWMANHPLAAMHADWNVQVDEARENQKALSLDALKSTRPIHAKLETPAEIEEAFDAIAYEKGAAVLRMVERYVGAETFRSGINAYLKAHAYSNATAEDFWTVIASTSGKPIDHILPTFIDQPGAPLLEVSLQCRNNGVTEATIHQQRFVTDAPPADTDSFLWQVPMCAKTADPNAAACYVVEKKTQVLDVARGCAPWVFVNAGAQGYYRTAYSTEALAALAPRVGEALSAPERLVLADDEWALVRAGRHTAADYLTLASGFAREHVAGVLATITERLAFIDEYLTTDAARTRFESFVRSLLRPLFDEIGFAPLATDTDDRKALRGTLVTAVGGIGADAMVVSDARTELDRALEGGPPLDPSIAAAVVSLAASHADAKLYDALMAAAERAASPTDRDLYLFAVGNFTDPALIDRALQYSLTPKLRSQDTALFFARMLVHRAARPRAWAFLKQHWAELQPKLVIAGGDTNLVASLSTFCDAGARDDVKSFFATHPLPSAARTLSQTIERIDNCIALREKQTPLVTDWLTAHATPAGAH